MAAKGNIFTGTRTRLSINGVVVGFCRNCNTRENIGREPFRGLGQLRNQEYVPVSYDVSFSAGFARIVGETLKSLGYQAKSGATPDEHLLNVLNLGSLTVTIEDIKTGKVLETVEQVDFTSRSTSYQNGSIVMTDCEFVGILSRDESEA